MQGRTKKGFAELTSKFRGAVLAAFAVAFAACVLGTSVVAGAASSTSGTGPVAHTAGLKKCLKKAKQIQDPVKRKKAKKKCHLKFGSAPGTGTGTGTGTGSNPLANCTATNKCATSLTMTGCPPPSADTSRALPVSVSGVLSPDAGGSPISISYYTYSGPAHTSTHNDATVLTEANGAWSFSYTPGSPGTGEVGEGLYASFNGDATRNASLTAVCNWYSN
jgi:hypothetical protein